MKKYFCFTILCSLFLLMSCDITESTSERIHFRNETDYNVQVSFIYDLGKKDSLYLPDKGSINNFLLFTYEYNKKTTMDSTVLFNQLKKLKIYRIVSNDTIYVNPVYYNRFKNWTEYIWYDMHDRGNDYIFTITNDMFD